MDKLKAKNIKVSSFVRKAIKEKIERDYFEINENTKEKTPFD